jgi:hypothetical protein
MALVCYLASPPTELKPRRGGWLDLGLQASTKEDDKIYITGSAIGYIISSRSIDVVLLPTNRVRK